MIHSSALIEARTQRSHLLLILSNPEPDQDAPFRRWYKEAFREALLRDMAVARLDQYEQHEIDILQGRMLRLAFKYLTICELRLDGAEEATELLETVAQLHRNHSSAQAPATWLYYPASDKVGHTLDSPSELLTVAFANGLPGREQEFREWYATRHIRHALNITAFANGQCFEQTLFQRAGAMAAAFQTIAIYEQTGTPQSIIESFASLAPNVLQFPSIDLSRFSESTYRRL